ncbi:hypothetical protein MNBD_NITROSPINAE04-1322 [hydrothermal vent metagenome]|uniref:TPM domain-containing protein n=1 Tax=hydrothermal vent metagenome TaxID=652676 RepID=A0A3B1B9Z5_9ZZZZ
MKRCKAILLILVSLSVLPFYPVAGAFAITFPDKPDNKNFYVDKAGLINPKDGETINKMALDLLVKEKVPIYVVTINSLSEYEAAGYSIEGYTADLFDNWGVGFKDRNYGMLLLVSAQDRKARIALGGDYARTYDRQAVEVMNTLIVPNFKRGMFSEGIVEGVKGMDAMARGLSLPKPKQPWWILPMMVLGAVGFVLLIINLFKTGRSGWAWALIAFLGIALFFMMRSAAQGGGSGGGFGGGFSGGGGATGSW